MLSMVIVIFLAIACYTGARRGLVLQVVHMLGYLISFTVARTNYRALSKVLELLVPYPSPTEDSNMVFYKANLFFKLDEAFYAGLAFILLVAIGWLITRFVGLLLHNLTFFPMAKQANTFGGAALGLITVYVGLFLILFLLSMIPLNFIQEMYRNSDLARFIVKNTPYFSKKIYDLWITSVI